MYKKFKRFISEIKKMYGWVDEAVLADAYKQSLNELSPGQKISWLLVAISNATHNIIVLQH